MRQIDLTAAQWQTLALFVALAGLWAVASWLAEPFFGLLYYGVVGLTMSTFARSRGTAIVLMVAAHFCLALGLYAPASQLGTLLLTPLAAIGGSTATDGSFATGAFFVLTIVLQIGLQGVLPWVVLVAGAVFTLRRVELLSD